MSTNLKEINSYLVKCRCCVKDLYQEDNLRDIDENVEKLIRDLTTVELVSSPLLSSHICEACSSQFEEIQKFKENLVSTQSFLLNLLEGIIEDLSETTSSDTKLALEPETIIKTEQEPELLISASSFTDVLSTKDPELFIPFRTSPTTKTRSKKKHRAADEYPDNTCPLCGKKFTEKRKIPLHIKRVHTKIKDFHCDQCDYAAYTRFDIVRHVKNIHTPQSENSADKRICPDCGKTVRGNNQLTLHIRKKHLMIKKFQCDLCSFASYGKYEIRSHLEHIHIPKEFKESYACTLCPSLLSSSMGLKVHMQHKHSGLRPHACFCGKSFSLRETMKTHIRNVHKGERKFACQFCPKRFGQAVRLKDHINNNHGIKQEIPCTQCSKIFHSTRNLKAHLVYHDEPKFDCSHCGKKFYLSNKLKEHLKTHEGAKHSCNLCSRTFQLMSSLKRHVKNHKNQCIYENCK